MLIEKELIEKAKEKLGDKNALIISNLLNLEDFDEKNLRACCPYHTEGTPSFIYNKKNKTFHCFGCNKTVDIIDVLMEKGSTFLDAVKYLFEKADISYSFGEQDVKTKRNYKYPHEEPINEKQHVLEYWGKRGISKRVIDYLDIREDGHGNGVFNYYDTNDVLTMVKYRPARTIDKTSKQPKTWCQPGADSAPLLFNMNRVNTSNPLLICEGETDCASAIEAGYLNTVSVPLGAGNFHWIEENWNWLDEFDSIIIWSDNDAPGEKMRKDCIYRLGTWRTKYILTPRYYEKPDGKRIPLKDINDCLQIGGKDFVLSLISDAQDVPVQSVVDYSDIEELDISQMDGVITGIKPLDNELLKIFYGTLTILSGRPGCVDSETEFFNGIKWKRICEYEQGDKVLQYNSDGTTRLVNPIEYHKYPCNTFWKIKTDDGINQVVSDEHNLITLDRYGKIKRTCAVDFVTKHNRSILGNKDQFITTFKYEGDGFGITSNRIRLALMMEFCGCFKRENRYYVVIDQDRQNSKRLKYLLDKLGFEYTLNNHLWRNQILFIINSEVSFGWLRKYWHKFQAYELAVVVDECNRLIEDTPKKYELMVKNEAIADLIQIAYASVGIRATITQENYNRFTINIKKDCLTSISKAYQDSHPNLRNGLKRKTVINKIETGDGYKYCFTVPSGMLVLRRNGDINITGNSGKTSIIDQTIAKTIDKGNPVFLFSKEMPERMSANWFNTIIAGRRNLEEKTTKDGRKYYVVPTTTQKKMQAYYNRKLLIYKDNESNDVESVMRSAEECVRKYGVKLVVLDNLMMLDLHCSEADKNTAQTNLINTLIKFAGKYNVAVVLIAHPRKTQDTNSDIEMYDISGSSNIINLAMRSIGLRRVSKKEKEDPDSKWGKYDVVLTVIKDRLLGKADFQMGLWYDLTSRRFYTDYEEYDAQFAWDNNVYPCKLPYVDRLNPDPDDIFPDK